MATRIREQVSGKLISFFQSKEWKTPLNVYEIALTFGEREEPEDTKKFWIDEYCGMLNRHFKERLKRPEAESFQMFLPGFSGDLHEQIQVRDGTVVIADATIRELRQNVKVFIAESRTKVKEEVEAVREKLNAEVDRIAAERKTVIREMSPYSRIRHSLTVTEFVRLKAAGVTVEAFAKEKTRAAGGKAK